MRVVHLCYSDSLGGAAIGAYRLHNAMRSRGVDSRMLVAHKGTRDESVFCIVDDETREQFATSQKFSNTIRSLYGAPGLSIRSINLSGIEVASIINSHRPDIVQLHWIANNTVPLSELSKIDAPIVWKMPDMWAFCGGEHYIRHGDPKRYKDGYDVTEPFLGEKIDVDRFLWEAKRRFYEDLPLTVVSPSKFLAQCAHESVLLSKYDAHHIPNPLPFEFTTRPLATDAQKKNFRGKLGLGDKMVFLFSAFQATEVRKGYHHLEALALQHLHKIIDPEQVNFLVIGGAEQTRTRLGRYDVIVQPQTDDKSDYLEYLLATDLLLFPSEMDSTAMVVQEALAQGVPTVAFDVGGMPEMIVHEKNGYLARPYDVADLADGVKWWLESGRGDDVRDYALRRSRGMHNPGATVERYVSLYEGVLDKYRKGSSFKTGRLSLRDLEKPPEPDKARVFIIDPSAVNLEDSSHHAEHVLAFAAMFWAAWLKPHLVVNKNATFENPFGDTVKALDWTIYDKVRSHTDRRSEEAVDGDEIANLNKGSQYSHKIRKLLTELDEKYNFHQRDIVLFPTIDRFCIEGLLKFLFACHKSKTPSFHINIMFERAGFLLGGYPLGALIEAIARSGYVDRKIFLYSETQQMANDLTEKFAAPVNVLRPPSVFSAKQIKTAGKNPNAKTSEHIFKVFDTVSTMLHEKSSDALFRAPRGKIVISSPGRGRRDKGWSALPDIIEAFNRTPQGNRAVLVLQRPRAMDGLAEELKRLESIGNVILLDEILSGAFLDSLCDQTDIFLLPYLPEVYRNRGSAFCWRAAAGAKPMVVTEGTALSEALMEDEGFSYEEASKFSILPKTERKPRFFANGAVADDPENFARSIADVIVEMDSYKIGAEKMCAKYYIDTVTSNPLKKFAYSDYYYSPRRTLILRCADDPAAPDKAYDGMAVEAIVGDGKATPLIDDKWSGVLRVSVEEKADGLTKAGLPEFLAHALSNQNIASLYVSRQLAIGKGALRELPQQWVSRAVIY